MKVTVKEFKARWKASQTDGYEFRDSLTCVSGLGWCDWQVQTKYVYNKTKPFLGIINSLGPRGQSAELALLHCLGNPSYYCQAVRLYISSYITSRKVHKDGTISWELIDVNKSPINDEWTISTDLKQIKKFLKELTS